MKDDPLILLEMNVMVGGHIIGLQLIVFGGPQKPQDHIVLELIPCESFFPADEVALQIWKRIALTLSMLLNRIDRHIQECFLSNCTFKMEETFTDCALQRFTSGREFFMA